MLFHGEHGDCFVRMNGKRSLTLLAGNTGMLQLYVKDGVRIDDAALMLRPDGGEYGIIPAYFSGEYDGYRVFEAKVCFDRDGLFFFKFKITSDGGLLYSSCGNGDGVLVGGGGCDSQLLVFDRRYDAPEWLSGGVFYHIFIDRFARGGNVVKRDDAIMLQNWDGGIPEYEDGRHKYLNNTFFGGTLYGAAEKLDYLSALGVTCVYLSPCFESFSNHKYDVGDYMKVDAMFGGDEALEMFVSEADKRGISVILDGVFNHVGDDSVYFNRFGRYGNTGACRDKASRYYDWFTFIHYPDEYECWWGIDNLPKVRRTEDFRRFICDEVIPKYMAMGIKGFRLDVADELEADFLDEITASVKKCRRDGIVLGEVWEDASCKVAYGERKRYFRGAQLDSVMNYPVRSGIIKYIKNGDSALLKDTLCTLLAHYPEKQLHHTMNILGTHDTERIISVLGDDGFEYLSNDELASRKLSCEARQAASERTANAYAILAFIIGVPCIYYGDECGLEGYRDPFCRRPYPWSSGDGKLRKKFTALNALRHSEEALKRGSFEVLQSDDDCLMLVRHCGGEGLLLLSNMSHGEKSLLGMNLPHGSVQIYKKRDSEAWYRLF